MSVARQNVDKLRSWKSISDYADLDAALVDIQANGGRVYFPSGTHTVGDSQTDESIFVYGEGLQSILNGSFEITTGTGEVVLSAKDILFSGDTSSSLKVTQAGAQDMVLDIERISVTGADAAVTIRNSGEIVGHIMSIRAEDLTQFGINVGWNDWTAQQGWGPVFICFNHIKDVDGGAGASAYGILTYAKNSVVIGNVIDGVTSDSGNDTEGLYTKAPYSVLVGNILKDAGEGEAFLNLKGRGLGGVDVPNGHNIIAVGHNIYGTDAWISAAAQTVAGVNVASDNVMVSNTIVDNITEAGVVLTAGDNDLENIMVSDLIVRDSTVSRGAVQFGSTGTSQVLRNFILSDITGIGIYVFGIDGDSADICISDGVLRTISGAGVSFRPNEAAGLVNCSLNNLVFDDISGAACIFFDDAMMNRVEMIDIDCGLRTADFVGREAAAGANSWYIRNLHGRVQTTSASAVDLVSLNVPQGSILTVTARFTGAKSDGTKLYHLETKASYSNAAGTAALIDTASTIFTKSVGSPTYAGTIAASGAGIIVRVAGATSETVNWRVSIDAETT